MNQNQQVISPYKSSSSFLILWNHKVNHRNVYLEQVFWGLHSNPNRRRSTPSQPNPNCRPQIPVSRIKTELSSADASSVGAALVTTAQGKYFSNGYDLAWVYNSSPYSPATTKQNAIQMSKELRLLVLDLISLPIPTVAAVNGHAVAAGMILALCHDYVVMRSDRGFMYMSELDLGMRIPRWFIALLRSKIAQPADRREVLLAASRVGAKRAMEMGVVDEAYEGAAETVAGAMRLAEDVAAAGMGKAYGESRKVMLADMIDVIGFDETVEGEVVLPSPPPGEVVSRL